jgi:hypothetical protein
MTGGSVSNNTAVGGDTGGVGGGCPGCGGAPGAGQGGALFVAGGTVGLNGTVVESNLAESGNGDFGNEFTGGGGLYVAASGTVIFCGATVDFNATRSRDGGLGSEGGGIYSQSGATVYLDTFTVNNTISNTSDDSPSNINGTYIPQNC